MREGFLTALFPRQIFFHAVDQEGADPFSQKRKQSSRGWGQFRLSVKQ